MTLEPPDRLINVISDALVERDGMELTIAILVRHTITTWANDLRRNLARAAQGLAIAAEKPLTDEGLDAIEHALWRLAAAKKSLLAVCFLSLGVPTIRPGRVDKQADKVKKSVQFELDAKRLERKLLELSKHQACASQLNALLVQIAEHPAIQLRDEITHSLAPIKEPAELCYFEIEEIGAPPVAGRPVNALWPRGMTRKKDISSKALWKDALADAKQALTILLEAVSRAADLLEEVGVENRPQRVYRDTHTEEIRMRP